MKIKWVGEDRMVPGCGMGTLGATLDVPSDIAKSYIKQGLAESVTTYGAAKTEKKVAKGDK